MSDTPVRSTGRAGIPSSASAPRPTSWVPREPPRRCAPAGSLLPPAPGTRESGWAFSGIPARPSIGHQYVRLLLQVLQLVVIPAAALATVVAACASEGFPPGGPEDLVPPALVETSPAERAVNAAPDQAITLRFDEVIDDQQLARLPTLIRVNPDIPDFDIQLEEDIVTLIPQAPMVGGLTYSVTVLPGLRDRAGNATVTPRTILFAVGGEEPITLSIVRATIVRDTVPAAGAFYRLENPATDFGYTAVADSQGQVALEAVAYGPYVATAWMETESPQGWQPTEEPGARDTFELSLESRAHEATYRIAVVDTTAPIVARVQTPASQLIAVTLDDPLPEGVQLAPGDVVLYAAALPDADIDPDSLPLEAARARRVAVASVKGVGPTTLEVVPAEPLRPGGIYRIELREVENVSGITATPEGGRTFRAEYEGPMELPSDPIPWPTPGTAAPPGESPPGEAPP